MTINLDFDTHVRMCARNKFIYFVICMYMYVVYQTWRQVDTSQDTRRRVACIPRRYVEDGRRRCVRKEGTWAGLAPRNVGLT